MHQIEKIVEIIKSIDFSRLEFKASDANDEDSIYKDTLKKLKELLPIHQIYVLDGNETKHFIKFLDGNYVKKMTKLDTRYFKNGFVFLHTTGKDDIIRWFYLNQPNKAMYLLSELSKP